MHIPISWTGSKFERTKVYSHLIQTKAYLLTFQSATPSLGTCFKEELQRRSVGHVLSKIRTQCILMTGQGLYLCASTVRSPEPMLKNLYDVAYGVAYGRKMLGQC